MYKNHANAYAIWVEALADAQDKAPWYIDTYILTFTYYHSHHLTEPSDGRCGTLRPFLLAEEHLVDVAFGLQADNTLSIAQPYQKVP